MIPCPNRACPNYGRQCWKCCNHCGNDILWRPPLLDKEIAYSGPKPLNKDATVHRCMLQGTKDGRFYKTKPVKEPENPFRTWPDPPVGVILGESHLWVDGRFTPLLKCPYCNFRNIHPDTMTHHIRFTVDKSHG